MVKKKPPPRKVVVQVEGVEAEFIARSAWSRDLEEKIKEVFQESFEEEVDVSIGEMVARINEITRERLGLKGTKIVARPKPRVRKVPVTGKEFNPGSAPFPDMENVGPEMSNTDRVRKVFDAAGAEGASNAAVSAETGLTLSQVQKLIHSLFHRGELKKFKKAHYVSAHFFSSNGKRRKTVR